MQITPFNTTLFHALTAPQPCNLLLYLSCLWPTNCYACWLQRTMPCWVNMVGKIQSVMAPLPWHHQEFTPNSTAECATMAVSNWHHCTTHAGNLNREGTGKNPAPATIGSRLITRPASSMNGSCHTHCHDAAMQGHPSKLRHSSSSTAFRKQSHILPATVKSATIMV